MKTLDLPRTNHFALRGSDRLRYFGPSLFVGYLTVLCAALTLISAAFTTLPDPAAIIATGIMGTALTGGLTLLVFKVQRRDLRYRTMTTRRNAEANYATVYATVTTAGWIIVRSHPGQSIEVEVSGTFLSRGEMISCVFQGQNVKLAAICDPQVGFSLAGRRRCREHLQRITEALAN